MIYNYYAPSAIVNRLRVTKSVLHTAPSTAKQTVAGKRSNRRGKSKSRSAQPSKRQGESHSKRSKSSTRVRSGPRRRLKVRWGAVVLNVKRGGGKASKVTQSDNPKL